jgi:hypothetical protein
MAGYFLVYCRPGAVFPEGPSQKCPSASMDFEEVPKLGTVRSPSEKDVQLSEMVTTRVSTVPGMLRIWVNEIYI